MQEEIRDALLLASPVAAMWLVFRIGGYILAVMTYGHC